MVADALFSSASVEWRTPDEWLHRVAEVLSEIDLDPCAAEDQVYPVPVGDRMTEVEDGLIHPWHGRIYMNPPYGREIGRWIDKLWWEYQHGHVTEAIALLPARTDTQWWKVLERQPVCFVTGRITFVGAPNPAPFPSAFVYFGHRPRRFRRVFQKYGVCYLPAARSPL